MKNRLLNFFNSTFILRAIIISLIVKFILEQFLSPLQIHNLDLELDYNYSDLFIIFVSSVVLAPIFEELLFRSWFDFNFKNSINISFFAIFLISFNDIILCSKLSATKAILPQIYYNLYNWIYPLSDLYNIPFLGTTNAFKYIFFLLPIILVPALLISKSLGTFFDNYLNYNWIKYIMIIFSSFVFFSVHRNHFIIGNIYYNIFFLVIASLFLPYLRIKFGLKLAIAFHMLNNLIASFRIVYGGNLQLNILYNMVNLLCLVWIINIFLNEVDIKIEN